MYARVARWEGGDAEAMRQTAARIAEQSKTGPPPGVPATAFLLLIDPDGGRALAIGVFETEEDRETGDRVLREMTPPAGANLGTRAAVEMYEVGVAAWALQNS